MKAYKFLLSLFCVSILVTVAGYTAASFCPRDYGWVAWLLSNLADLAVILTAVSGVVGTAKWVGYRYFPSDDPRAGDVAGRYILLGFAGFMVSAVAVVVTRASLSSTVTAVVAGIFCLTCFGIAGFVHGTAIEAGAAEYNRLMEELKRKDAFRRRHEHDDD